MEYKAAHIIFVIIKYYGNAIVFFNQTPHEAH